jgi:hypothetical protein
MKVLALISLDTNGEQVEMPHSLVVNNRERVRRAREYAARFSERERSRAFFAQLYDPDLVQFDQLEKQAHEQLALLEARGVQIIYVATRPHTLREVTEQWLTAHQILRPCVFKYDGSGKPGPDGKPDVGDRYVKHAIWKRNQIPHIIAEEETALGQPLDWVLIVDTDEATRQEVATINDPRLLIRCSLQDACVHDLQRMEADQSAPPFLRRLQELASLQEVRTTFDTAPFCSLHIERPARDRKHQSSILLEAWHGTEHAPGSGQHIYRYSELYPQRNELGETEQIIALQVTCDQVGQVLSVKMAKPGPALSLLSEMEEMFDPDESEQRQAYADTWIAHAIEEFGYVAAARAQRGIQLLGRQAWEAYREYTRAKSEELQAALIGHRDQMPSTEEPPAQPSSLAVAAAISAEWDEIRQGFQEEQIIEKKDSTIFERNQQGIIVPKLNAQVRIYLREKDIWRTYGSRRQKIGTEKIYELCPLLEFRPDWDYRLKCRGRIWVRPTENLLERYAGKPGIAYDEGWMELRETELHPEDREHLYLYCARKLDGGPLVLQITHTD